MIKMSFSKGYDLSEADDLIGALEKSLWALPVCVIFL